MPRLIAKQAFEYGVPPRLVKAGEEFECAESDASILKVIGRASDLLPRKAVKEDEADERPRRKYNRRDMTAEDA